MPSRASLRRVAPGESKRGVGGPWIGIDGCRAGWVVARLEATGRLGIDRVPTATEWVRRPSAMTLVDMPIGLHASGRVRPRGCDALARARLGPRRASVFSPPVRDMLGATEHAPLGRRGLSIQAFHLIPKIAELDDALEPVDQARVREAHPELVFTRLGGAPCEHGKRDARGRRERELLIEDRVPGALVEIERFLSNTLRRDVAVDDVLDAVALSIAARDHTAGIGWRLPEGEEAEPDARGFAMEVLG